MAVFTFDQNLKSGTMKSRNYAIILLVTMFFSGCVVYSFYPLYTEKDLFANDILTGEWESNEWMDDDDIKMHWSFEHNYRGRKLPQNIDSTSYVLTVITKQDDTEIKSEFSVHVIELAGQYFLDFYLEDVFGDDSYDLGAFHVVPIHTFAKLIEHEGKLEIHWFDQTWLESLIKENKIRVHHEKNNDYILLTAKPRELQKFIIKYVNSEEAFEDGLKAVLYRK